MRYLGNRLELCVQTSHGASGSIGQRPLWSSLANSKPYSHIVVGQYVLEIEGTIEVPGR